MLSVCAAAEYAAEVDVSHAKYKLACASLLPCSNRQYPMLTSACSKMVQFGCAGRQFCHVRCRSGQQTQLQTSARLPVHMLVQAVQPSIPPSEYVGFLASNGGELTSHHTLAVCDIQDEDVLEWVSHSEPTRMINISVFTEGNLICRP